MSAWVETRREAAKGAFDTQGLPTKAHEAWKTTPVRRLKDFDLESSPAPDDAVRTLAAQRVAALGPAGGHRVVLINGHLIDPPPTSLSGVEVMTLSDAIGQYPDAIEQSLGRIAPLNEAPMVALNGAEMADALVLRVDANVVVEEPVELVHVTVPTRGSAHPRVLITTGQSSQVTVIERFVSAGSDPCLDNAVTEVAVGANATVDHITVIEASDHALHLGSVAARVGRDGNFRGHVTALSGQVARTETFVTLGEQGGQCHLNGLYVGQGKSVLDHYTQVDHRAERTTAHELYRGILDDRSTGGFVGRVLIHEGARLTETHQLNNNLLLTEGAVAHTRPQLEIDHDDVAATHGSTVGQLDESAIFYLRSRGLSEAAARGLLTWAFARTVIDRLPTEVLKRDVAYAVASRLGTLDALEIED